MAARCGRPIVFDSIERGRFAFGADQDRARGERQEDGVDLTELGHHQRMDLAVAFYAECHTVWQDQIFVRRHNPPCQCTQLCCSEIGGIRLGQRFSVCIGGHRFGFTRQHADQGVDLPLLLGIKARELLTDHRVGDAGHQLFGHIGQGGIDGRKLLRQPIDDMAAKRVGDAWAFQPDKAPHSVFVRK